MWVLRASVSAWQIYIVLVLNTVRYLPLFLEHTQSDVSSLNRLCGTKTKTDIGTLSSTSNKMVVLFKSAFYYSYYYSYYGFNGFQATYEASDPSSTVVCLCVCLHCVSLSVSLILQASGDVLFYFHLTLSPTPHPRNPLEPSTPPMRDEILKLGMDQRDPVVLKHKFRNWYIYRSTWQWQAKGLNRSAE